ncbi:macro domain-containing protein [bacterium]|nr:macro domain-containing protein [bacterium]
MVDVVQGDITQLKVDGIVTSANESLMGGGGVDKAVHRAAGPGLLQECMKIGLCNPGQAVITNAHWLEVQKIIHTVGPIWEGGGYGEEGVLRSCYRAALQLAQEHQLAHIALPCIAAGVYEFPGELAARIAVEEVRAFMASNAIPQRVTFCCFQDQDLAHYQAALADG